MLGITSDVLKKSRETFVKGTVIAEHIGDAGPLGPTVNNRGLMCSIDQTNGQRMDDGVSRPHRPFYQASHSLAGCSGWRVSRVTGSIRHSGMVKPSHSDCRQVRQMIGNEVGNMYRVRHEQGVEELEDSIHNL